MNCRERLNHLTKTNRCATVQQQAVEQEGTTSDEHMSSDQLSNDEEESGNLFPSNNVDSPNLTQATSVEPSIERADDDDECIGKQDVSINTNVDSVSWHNIQRNIASQQELIELLSTSLKIPTFSSRKPLCSFLSSAFKNNPNVNH